MSGGGGEKIKEFEYFWEYWESLEEDAIYVGVDLEYFWSERMWPRRFRKYVNVFRRKNEEDLERLDSLNHVLGGYVRMAVADVLNGKSRYPKEGAVVKNIRMRRTRRENNGKNKYRKILNEDEVKKVLESLGKNKNE